MTSWQIPELKQTIEAGFKAMTSSRKPFQTGPQLKALATHRKETLVQCIRLKRNGPLSSELNAD